MQRSLTTGIIGGRNGTEGINVCPNIRYLGKDYSGTRSWRSTTGYGSLAWIAVGTTSTDLYGNNNSAIVTQWPTQLYGVFQAGSYGTFDTSAGNTTTAIRYGGNYSLNITTTDYRTLAIWIENQNTSRTFTIKIQTQAGVDLISPQTFDQLSPANLPYFALWQVGGAFRINIGSSGDNPYMRLIALS
jgi:hypothetical protein